MLVPYVLVLVGGLIGINVFIVLLIGIVSGIAITLFAGNIGFYDLLTNMGSGASGMFETIMVTVLVSALCGLIRDYGGFVSLLGFIRRIFKGNKGGQLGMGLLVGAMDLAIVAECGYKISAFDVIPKLYYPFLLAVISVGFIFLGKRQLLYILYVF